MEIPPMHTGEDIKTNLIGVHKGGKKKKNVIEENSPKLKKGLNLKKKNHFYYIQLSVIHWRSRFKFKKWKM